MSTYWEKLLDIVDRTRDKIFFFSANRTYVVMSLDQYEALTDQQSSSSEKLISDDSLEQINKEVALFKAKIAQRQEDQVAADLEREQSPEGLITTHSINEEPEKDQDDEFHIEPVEIR